MTSTMCYFWKLNKRVPKRLGYAMLALQTDNFQAYNRRENLLGAHWYIAASTVRSSWQQYCVKHTIWSIHLIKCMYSSAGGGTLSLLVSWLRLCWKWLTLGNECESSCIHTVPLACKSKSAFHGNHRCCNIWFGVFISVKKIFAETNRLPWPFSWQQFHSSGKPFNLSSETFFVYVSSSSTMVRSELWVWISVR